MTGARRLARAYILPMMSKDLRVLDICSGDAWVFEEFKHLGILYQGVDLKNGVDVTKDEPWKTDSRFFPPLIAPNPDLIISCYGLQHLLAEEARVWTLLRRISKPSTQFVYVGRPAIQCWREFDRADPLNAYSREGFSDLAAASGWFVDDWKEFLYVGDSYSRCTPEHLTVGNPNAFCATLGPLA